jgi:hypothetical protein
MRAAPLGTLRYALLLIAVSGCLALQACGARQDMQTLPQSSHAGFGGALPGLPKDAAPGQAPRGTSAYTFGEADLYGAQGATMVGNQLHLDAAGLSYAILGVDTGGQVPASVRLSGSMTGIYTGVSDYSNGVWRWVDGPRAAPGTLSLPASGTLSPGGSIYIALVCPGGASADISVSLALDMPGSTWNLLVWIAGDNDLAPDAVDNLNAMESIGSSDELCVLAGYDIDPTAAPGVSGIDQVRFIKVVHDTRAGVIVTDGDPANVSFARAGYNSADPAKLAEFLDWAQQNFPCDHQALVLWDHGDGWLPGWKGASAAAGRLPRRPSGILGDFSDGDYDLTDNAAVAAVLAGRQLDLLCFDACNMAHVEALYDFRNAATWLCATEVLFPASGYPYAQIIPAWRAALPVNAQALAQIFVDQTYDFYNGNEYVCQAAIRANALGPLAAALQAAAADVTAKAGAEGDHVKAAIEASFQPESGDGEHDLQGFLLQLRMNTTDTALQDLLSNALVSFSACVDWYQQYGLPGSNGVAVYLPNTGFFNQEYQDMYAASAFNVATGWLDMLKATGVPAGSGEGMTIHWQSGDKIEIAWDDNAANIDIALYDPSGNFGGPWDSSALDYCMSFSPDNPSGGDTFEWARLKAGAPEGDYYIGVANNGYAGSPPAQFTVTVKLYNSADQLKQDLGVCTVDLFGYVDYAVLRNVPQ